MKGRARFSHTNLIAGNWKSLARFYEEVFGCKPVPPERHYRGSVLARGTGVSGAELHGVHLRLPGFGDAGPTLEIYSYEPQEARVPSVVNRPGFGHIAFEVDDIAQTRQAILDASGSTVADRYGADAGALVVAGGCGSCRRRPLLVRHRGAMTLDSQLSTVDFPPEDI